MTRLLILAASLCLVISNVKAQTTSIISYSSSWKYLVTSSDPGSAWSQTSYNDASWSTAPASLGYGQGNPTSVISFGPDANNKYLTTYFRKSVTISNPASYTTIAGNIRRDDGAVIYINGTEVFRTNMPSGSVNYSTLGVFADDNGATPQAFSFSSSLLTAGNNVIAVEIHQSAATSSDIYFDLELTGTNNQVPSVIITSPANNSTFTPGNSVTIQASASDADGSINKVEFYADGNLLGQATSAPYAYTYTNVPAGTYSLTAKAYDNLNLTTTSAAITISGGQSLPATQYPGIGYVDNSSTVGIWGDGSSSSSPIISLTPQQSIGIGVLTPPAGYKLAVNGSAIFTRIKVKEYSSWPDYVFDHSYKLPGLSYVESYIKKFHHLPEVPSAKEVEQTGLDVGEQQIILLKKIEELTLYIIDQNKKLEEQSNRIKLLESKINRK